MNNKAQHETPNINPKLLWLSMLVVIVVIALYTLVKLPPLNVDEPTRQLDPLAYILLAMSLLNLFGTQFLRRRAPHSAVKATLDKALETSTEDGLLRSLKQALTVPYIACLMQSLSIAFFAIVLHIFNYESYLTYILFTLAFINTLMLRPYDDYALSRMLRR